MTSCSDVLIIHRKLLMKLKRTTWIELDNLFEWLDVKKYDWDKLLLKCDYLGLVSSNYTDSTVHIDYDPLLNLCSPELRKLVHYNIMLHANTAKQQILERHSYSL